MTLVIEICSSSCCQLASHSLAKPALQLSGDDWESVWLRVCMSMIYALRSGGVEMK